MYIRIQSGVASLYVSERMNTMKYNWGILHVEMKKQTARELVNIGRCKMLSKHDIWRARYGLWLAQ